MTELGEGDTIRLSNLSSYVFRVDNKIALPGGGHTYSLAITARTGGGHVNSRTRYVLTQTRGGDYSLQGGGFAVVTVLERGAARLMQMALLEEVGTENAEWVQTLIS